MRIDPAEAAFVIVWFPAQHLMEQAFWQGAEDIPGPVPVPVLALHAGPSRLVFMLPEDRDDLPLTLERARLERLDAGAGAERPPSRRHGRSTRGGAEHPPNRDPVPGGGSCCPPTPREAGRTRSRR